jgi:hypothetical protein
MNFANKLKLILKAFGVTCLVFCIIVMGSILPFILAKFIGPLATLVLLSTIAVFGITGIFYSFFKDCQK